MNKRAYPATEVPLDESRRNGTESWRERAGVAFCHWDRWLLRLALDEPNGLRSIAATFEGPAFGVPKMRTLRPSGVRTHLR
jgi:hypothetical protein